MFIHKSLCLHNLSVLCCIINTYTHIFKKEFAILMIGKYKSTYFINIFVCYCVYKYKLIYTVDSTYIYYVNLYSRCNYLQLIV